MNEIISSGIRLYFRFFGVILGLVLTVGLPCQALSSYVLYHVFGKDNVVAAVQVPTFIELIFGIVLTGGILHALFVDRMDRRASFIECLGVSIGHWFQLCWTNFLMTSIISMAAALFLFPIGPWQIRILLLIPALFLAARLSLAITIVMVEGEWGASALKRSLSLTIDKSWRILGLGLLVYLPVQVISFIGIRMLQTNPQLDTWEFTTAYGTFLKLISCIIPVCFFRLYETLIEADHRED